MSTGGGSILPFLAFGFAALLFLGMLAAYVLGPRLARTLGPRARTLVLSAAALALAAGAVSLAASRLSRAEAWRAYGEEIAFWTVGLGLALLPLAWRVGRE